MPNPLADNRATRRRWLKEIRKSDLSAEAKQLASWVADSANRQGVIEDPVLVALLEDVWAGK